MKKSAKMLVMLMCVVLFFLCSGCHKVTVLIISPGFDDVAKYCLNIDRINSAYQSAVKEFLNENKEAFKIIKLENITFIQSDKIYQEYKKEGITTFKKYLGDDHEVAIYTEISQPYNGLEFYYYKIHFYIASNGLRGHQSKRILVNYDTLCASEFWRSEFREIFEKLGRAV